MPGPTSRREGLDALFTEDGPFFVIAGPCLLEDDDLNLRVADALARIAADLDLPLIFKASFDKANRSRGASPRGPGLDDGLERLRRVRDASGLPVLTDIHEPEHAHAAAQACDVLQIPAFLCRQTDLLRAAGATGRPVNVKKGQWMAPEEMRGAAGKVREARPAGDATGGVAVTERGTFYGYGDLVVDMRSFLRMRRAAAAPVVFDGTHSVQRPGLGAGVSGGDPEFILPLVRAAVAAGADALFLEVHPAPERAPSDSTNMLRLDAFRPLLEQVLALRQVLAAPQAGAAARG
ncbi:MAG TPA: 3-deoxy-8-phosphooctulonate synthase [Longimicrobiales bacterium]|nr:3-deoxy-8-phosphooctulonate synthase [Longimicrobiales bacterium]